MPYRIRTTYALVALSVALCGLAADAEDWPHWRGPNYDGMSTETGFKTQWDGTPPIVWQREIGSGFSAITCVGGKVFTCGTQNKQQVLFCLDADTGNVVWQLPLEKAYGDRQGGDGPRGTPTINEGRVYVQGARGRFLCGDAAAIAIAGENDGPLVALNKTTGEPVWKAGSAPVGYSTPLAFTFDNRRYIAAMLGGSIIIVDPKTGREVWSKPWETSWKVNAATPIYHDGHLFFSSGYKHGSILLKLAHQGDTLTAGTAWEGQAIRAKFQTPILFEGCLYTSDEVNLKCIDFATGQEKWSKSRIKHGTAVIADGHLFVLTEQGKLLIGEASPEGFEPTTDVPILEGRCWTVPTLLKGRLYARDFKKIVCVQLAP